MDSISKVEYNVRNLTTRSVTLFPTRAQVFRDIKDVPLRPGLNEITIYGLTPTVDEHSIKVEGSGNAIISDIAVESLPNRDIFEDIYPDSDEDKSDSDDAGSAAEDEEPEYPESDELKAARKTLEDLQVRANRVADAHASTEAQHSILNDFSRTLKAGTADAEGKGAGVDIEDFLDSYRGIADRLREDWFDASAERRKLQVETDAARKELNRLLKKHRAGKREASRAWRKAMLARTKARIQEARREEERTKEKVRVRSEREKFWPKKCYAVRIQLTSNAAINTPMSSRRGSISSEAEFILSPGGDDNESVGSTAAAAATTTCNLVLSYVTSMAFWTPSYDLQLSTSTGTGTLCFDAQLNNTTSESWSKCKITLSTSQVSSSSLEEKVPSLLPWHLTTTMAVAGDATDDKRSLFYSDGLLQSREERKHNAQFWRQQRGGNPVAKGARHVMFGVEAPAPAGLKDYQMQLMLLEQQNKKRLMMARQEQQAAPPFNNYSSTSLFGQARPQQLQQQQQQQQAQQQALQQQQQQQSAASLFGAAQQQSAGFGSQSQQSGAALFGAPPPPQANPAAASSAFGSTNTSGGLFGSANNNNSNTGRSNNNNNNNNNTNNNTNTMGNASRPLEDAGALDDFDFDSFLGDDGGFGAAPRLDFEESLVDETGFTTTYDLPGQKTLMPRSNSSKQRVARINLSKIVFNHTVIAKYRPVAHLSAKIVNGSKLTLLKGPVGVTLDGSFMGRTNLPRCGSGESINLGLGADPTIRVTYPRPESKRATTGFFTKEDIKIFERCIRLENTKPVGPSGPGIPPAKPVRILVLDQIPVADSDKIRIELLKPEGLTVDGEWKDAGIPGKETKDKDKEVEKKEEDDKEEEDKEKEKNQDAAGVVALASLKKKGEVTWTVRLKPGKALRLPLEYLVAVPIGEKAIQSQ